MALFLLVSPFPFPAMVRSVESATKAGAGRACSRPATAPAPWGPSTKAAWRSGSPLPTPVTASCATRSLWWKGGPGPCRRWVRLPGSYREGEGRGALSHARRALAGLIWDRLGSRGEVSWTSTIRLASDPTHPRVTLGGLRWASGARWISGMWNQPWAGATDRRSWQEDCVTSCPLASFLLPPPSPLQLFPA